VSTGAVAAVAVGDVEYVVAINIEATNDARYFVTERITTG
jgi:hypothetical protein